MEDSSLSGLCERFMYDIQEYLEAKLEETVSEDVILEISVHIANRFGVSVIDILNERDKEWRTAVNRLMCKERRKKEVREDGSK